jgi:Zn-dependent protease
MIQGAHWLPEVLAAILAAVVAITLHEAAHGYAALAMGDTTARDQGRLSLNPWRHVDDMGTLIVPGLLLIVQVLTIGRVEFLFGWAKPVPVDALAMRNPRSGMAWVALAGPAMNFALALLAGLSVHLVSALIWPLSPDSAVVLYRFIWLFILSNLVLGLFNLLPIPPLDGGRVVNALLPARAADMYMRLERWGILLVLLLVFVLPRLTHGIDPVGWLLQSVLGAAIRFVIWATGNGAMP